MISHAQPPPTDIVVPVQPGTVQSVTEQGAVVPDIIVNNLPAATGWLTQPVATLGAGVLAIIAACIAFGGVYLTQRVNRSTAKAQLRQQAAASVRQERSQMRALEAAAANEREKHHRETRSAALSEALSATMVARDAIVEYRGNLLAHSASTAGLSSVGRAVANSRPPDSTAARLATDALVGRAATLLMLGDEDAYMKMMTFSVACRRALDDEAEFGETQLVALGNGSTLAVDAIRKAYQT